MKAFEIAGVPRDEVNRFVRGLHSDPFSVLGPHKVGDDSVTDPSILIVDVKRMIAKSDNEVAIKAAREIPEEYLDKLEQVEIAIRPF